MKLNSNCKHVVLLAAAPLMLVSQPALAASKDDWATVSDVGVGSLVAWSLAVPVIEGDTQGALQAGAATATGFLTATGLKQVFPETRPDGSGNDSFPSGHTATAFAAATSILDRRGPAEGIPALAVASLVGFARVRADKHYWYDVLAGAAIGSASGLLITHSKDGKSQTMAWGDTHTAGFTYAARF